MKKNIGKADKLIRSVAVLVIALLSYFNIISGVFGYVLLGVAVILLITSFLNFSPLYTLFGINTCSIEDKPKE
mgnify:CR=1 FL=1